MNNAIISISAPRLSSVVLALFVIASQASALAKTHQLEASEQTATAVSFDPGSRLTVLDQDNPQDSVPVDSDIAVATETPPDSASIALVGPHGVESVETQFDAVANQLRLQPNQEMLPGSRYTLVVSAPDGETAPNRVFEFETESIKPSHFDHRLDWRELDAGPGAVAQANPEKISPSEHFSFLENVEHDPEFWTPSSVNLERNWRTGTPLPEPIATAINLSLSRNSILALGREERLQKKGAPIANVSGQVLKLNDEPLANARVTLGGKSILTDSNGEFKMAGLEPGQHQMIIDGGMTGKADERFAESIISIEVFKDQTTPIKPVYLPKIRSKDWIEIPSPLTKDLVIKSDTMPGFEIHLPAGTVLRDRAGKIVRRIASVPLPLDRVPVEYPVNTPLHMTLQPAGMHLESLTPGETEGIRFVYPNYAGAQPGTQAAFLNYDPSGKGWYTYGYGTVSQDSLTIVPDKGTAVYSATGFGISFGAEAPAETTPNQCGDPARDGDPVDLKTGLFLHDTIGPQLQDIMPISMTTKYRPNDATLRSMGRGTSLSYDAYLHFPGPDRLRNWSEFDLVMPDCSVLKFEATAGGEGPYQNVAWRAVHTGSPSPFYGAEMRQIPSEAAGTDIHLTRRDGTVWVFNLHGGRLVRIIDRNGRRTEMTRVNGGHLGRITSPSGRYVDATYHGSVGLTRLTDMSGRSWQYGYNSAGYLDQVTYPDNTIERFVYDANNRMEEVYNRLGQRMVKNTYNADGRVVEQILADGAHYAFDYVTDSTGDVTETFVTQPNGSMRHVTFHSSGYPLTDTQAFGDPLQRTVTYERDGVGFVTATTDPLGRRTEFDYNNAKQLMSVTALAGTADARTTDYSYYDNYDVHTITDPNNDTLTVQWDNQRRLTSVQDSYGRSVALSYDIESRVRSITDHHNRQTLLGYNLFDLVNITDPHGRVSRRFVDALGRVTALHDPLNRATYLGYDTNDNVNEVTDSLNRLTRYSYDALGNLKSLIDPMNNVTEWQYDARQRVTQVTDALNQVSTCNYAADALTASCTDRGNRQVSLVFDALTRLDNITYQADGSQVTLAYDVADRLTTINDTLSGAIGYQYNDYDQLAVETTPAGSTNYDYDARLRLSDITPSGLTAVSYGYDTRDRLTSITQGSDVVTMAYDALERRSQVTLPNGVSTTAGYDTLDRLTSLTYSQGGQTLGNLTFGYDQAGQIISRGGSWDEPILPTLPTSQGLADGNHRLTQWDNQVLNYDVHGNLLDDGVYTYEYDSRDRLTAMHQGGSVYASFQYDAAGRRTSKTINGTTTSYRYDGENPIAEVSNGTTKQILAGPGIDERYARDDDTGRSYFLTDQLGSTVALTGSAGELQGRYKYEAYGEAQFDGVGGFQSSNPYQYTGRENDGTGLYYYRARYFSPTAKRFTQEDPLGFVDGPSAYTFVKGSPIIHRDPDGRAATLVTGAVGAGFGALLGGTFSVIGGGTFAEGALSGAIQGGLTGLTLGLSGVAVAGTFGGRIIGGAAAGGVASGAGNLGLQGLNIANGSQCGLDIDGLKASVIGGVISGALFLRPYTAPRQQVTSWAGRGKTPNLDSTRFAMTGSSSIRNFIATGRFRQYPFHNSITGVRPSSSIRWPSGWEAFKGHLGQRVIR